MRATSKKMTSTNPPSHAIGTTNRVRKTRSRLLLPLVGASPDDLQGMLSWRVSATTIFLGRLLGLYLVAISIGMLANRQRTLARLDEMARNGPWMLFSGMVALTAGLAIVLGQNV